MDRMSTSRTDEITQTLRGRIVAGEIVAGEKLPSEATLVAEFGASRTVVREAMQRLQSLGLVRTRRGSGSYALTPPSEPVHGAEWLHAKDAAEREELHGFRTAVELETAALAALRAPEHVVAEMTAALENFDAATNPAAALEADFAFHRAVALASGNRYLAAAIDRLGPSIIVMPSARLDAGADPVRTATVRAEHAAVLDAIRRKDPLSAAAAMRSHLDASRRRRSGHS